jgi:bacillithiol biosynthesis deacetylase BshB1
MKVNILAFAAHPDDVELACAGTIALHVQKGYKVAIVDLTAGELGTRGTPEIRAAEAKAASEILGIHARENLMMADGFFVNDKAHQLKVIAAIRKYRPEIVIANAPSDRHPDHGKGADLVRDAFFLSGLRMIETTDEQGNQQEAYRPKHLFHYMQNNYLKPDFVVDISPVYELRKMAIKAYKSQFYDPLSQEPITHIARPEFLLAMDARAREMGHAIGVEFGEGFVSNRTIGISDLEKLI